MLAPRGGRPPPRSIARMSYVRFLVFAVLAWWPMQVVHEAGHVAGCWWSGAHIEQVKLWPWTFSETVRSGSAHPLIDTWAGPLVGAVLPWAACLLARRAPRHVRRALGVFAGYGLVANGCYLGLGWLVKAGDAGDLLRLGVSPLALSAFGLAATAAGLWWWHREGWPAAPDQPLDRTAPG